MSHDPMMISRRGFAQLGLAAAAAATIRPALAAPKGEPMKIGILHVNQR
jgi:hypothetical protein